MTSEILVKVIPKAFGTDLFKALKKHSATLVKTFKLTQAIWY